MKIGEQSGWMADKPSDTLLKLNRKKQVYLTAFTRSSQITGDKGSTTLDIVCSAFRLDSQHCDLLHVDAHYQISIFVQNILPFYVKFIRKKSF